jgi:hypothetical protein
VTAHWIAHRVIALKKQIHPRLEYNRLQDPTLETTKKIEPDHLVKLLEEMFQNTSSWLIDGADTLLPYWSRKGLDMAPFFSLIFYLVKSYFLYVWM